MRRAARALVRGRSVIVGGGNLAGSTRRVHGLRELGAERCLVVATGVGTGPLPDPAEAESIVDRARGARHDERDARRRGDPRRPAAARWSPRSIGSTPIATRSCCWRRSVRRWRIGDRAAYGARPASWVALEDKTVGDALFDRAGVPRPPSRVVICGARRSCAPRPPSSTAVREPCGRATRRRDSTAAVTPCAGSATATTAATRSRSSPSTATGCASHPSSTACRAASTASSPTTALRCCDRSSS